MKSEAERAAEMGITVSEMRAQETDLRRDQRDQKVARALEMRKKGYSFRDIAQATGLTESSVRTMILK